MSLSQDFAQRVFEAFEKANRFTDTEVGAAGGPSTTTLTSLRKAARGELELKKPRNDTFRRIDDAANWNAGTARRMWDHLERGLKLAPEPGDAELNSAQIQAFLKRVDGELIAIRNKLAHVTALREAGQSGDTHQLLRAVQAAIELTKSDENEDDALANDVTDELLQSVELLDEWLENDHEAARRLRTRRLKDARDARRVLDRGALSEPGDTSDDAIAAHDEEVSIVGEQEESDTP